ncbi:TolC family protein [Porphyromonas pogonae]|uniref:TolC family protein n=1 Tax=Porphyromonas pogonae TaxID=867595 RepID=UPI002E78C29D|nr:TolC family protein [Porphyromonas pogonae]
MNIKRIASLLIVTGLTLSFGGYAQEVVPTPEYQGLSLDKCIEIAVKRNLNVKKQELNIRNSKIKVSSAQNAFLPSVGSDISQGWGFGRSQDKTGVFVQRSSSSSSFSIGGNITLFSGLSRLHNLNTAKLNLQAARENLEQSKNDISLNVAQNYITLLFQQELKGVTKLQIELTRRQLEKAQALVASGKWAKGKQMEVEAQLAKEEQDYVVAQNSENMARLILMQSMEITGDTIISIQAPNVDELLLQSKNELSNIGEIYNFALLNRPSVKSAELNIYAAEEMVKSSKSGHLPTLSLNMGYSNSYYYQLGKEYSQFNESFRNQLRNNGRSSIGLSLSIPIFNRFETRNQINQSKLEVLNSRLALEEEKKRLYKEVSEAYYNALSALKNISAAGKSVSSNKLAFDYAEERLKADKINVFEYNEAKTRYMVSLADELKAKYDFIFKSKVLNFYKGIPL